MLLHIYGPDDYRRHRAMRDILSQYRAKHPEGMDGYFDCSEDGAMSALQQFTREQGLFAKKQLAVIVNPGDGERPLVKLLKYQQDNEKCVLLVVAEKKLPKDFALLYGEAVGPKKKEYAELTGAAFATFLKQEVGEKGLSVSGQVLADVSALYAGDTWGAVTELLRVASGGAVAEKREAGDFIAAIRGLHASGRPDTRLRSLFLLLENDDPAKVFNMAAAFSGGAGKVRFADYDIAVKSGRIGYEEALLEYVLSG